MSTQLDIIGKQLNIIRPARSFWEKRIDPAGEICFHDKEEKICFDC